MQAEGDVLELLSRAIRSERALLASVARREGLDGEEAVDCVQDAFCTFLQIALRGELPEAGARASFLAGIVRNVARNRRRRHHLSRAHGPVDDLAAGDPAEAPDERLARAEEHIRLRACVDRLCDTQRAVVTLRMLEERDGEDVASALGITRGYVDVLMHRARSSLAACMLEPE